ncbi:hypothetical protein EBZ35_07355 [bacterium]|nr:hypothetical protein [bacterium]
MTLHSSTYKGKRVLIIFKNGDKKVVRFLDKKSGVMMTDGGKVLLGDVKSMTIYRPVDYQRAGCEGIHEGGS